MLDLRYISPYLDMDSTQVLATAPVFTLLLLIIVIHVCTILRTLTSPNFNMFRVSCHALSQSHLHLLAVFLCFILFDHFVDLRNASWQNNLFIFTPCLQFHSHPDHWDQTKTSICRSLESRPSLMQEHLFETTTRCLFVQSFQLLPSRNILRLPLPYRHQHTPWPVDVTELLHRFCCLKPIWLSL